MDFSEKIKDLRKRRGLTLEEVGRVVGVGKSTVRKWENGDIKNMRRDKIALLAQALGVSPSALMGWNDNETAPYDFNGQLFADKEEKSSAPRTIEARIVSAGMDDLPKEQRERILGVLRAMFINDPDLFKDRKEDQ